VQSFRSKGNQSAMDRGSAKVTVTAGAGIVATASVINNVTNDPTTITMHPWTPPAGAPGGGARRRLPDRRGRYFGGACAEGGVGGAGIAKRASSTGTFCCVLSIWIVKRPLGRASVQRNATFTPSTSR